MESRKQARDAHGKFVAAGGGESDAASSEAKASGGAATRTGARRRPKGGRRGARGGRRCPYPKAKRAAFFGELQMVCNVRSAFRSAKLPGSISQIYELRKSDAAFRAEWDEAIDQSYAMLELEMLERSRFGEDRPPAEGEAQERLRQVPNALALQLLRLHQNRARPVPAAAAAARRDPRPGLTGMALRREIERRLAELNRRMGGEG